MNSDRNIFTGKFQPRWRDRYQDRRRNFIKRVTWIALALLVAAALIYLANAVSMVNKAEARAEKAESERQQVLDVLAGKLAMIEPIEGDMSLARVARVEWDLVRKEK